MYFRISHSYFIGRISILIKVNFPKFQKIHFSKIVLIYEDIRKLSLKFYFIIIFFIFYLQHKNLFTIFMLNFILFFKQLFIDLK